MLPQESVLMISVASINSASPTDREAVLRVAGMTPPVLASDYSPEEQPVIGPERDSEDEELAALSEKNWDLFFQGVHPKTRDTLYLVADLGPVFRIPDICRGLGIPVDQLSSLGGVWSGLTKRTRTITKDKDAWLFSWDYDPETDNYTTGRMAHGTHQALKNVVAKLRPASA